MIASWLTGLGIISAIVMTLLTRAEAPQHVTLPPEWIDALDLAPPALRYAREEAELGAVYDIPGRSTGRYPLFVTGTHISIQVPPAATPPSAAAVPPIPSLRLVATGGGPAFRVEVRAGATAGRFLAPDGLVLEAVSIERAPTPPDGATIVTGLAGFSAEVAKDPPPAGTMYRVAPTREQERLKAIRYMLRTADALSSTGRLRPNGDPSEYLDFVKQWAIWTRLERWDVRQFGDVFTSRTRKTFESLKQPWTRDVEQRVRALVPGRWGDVQTVLTTADVLANRARR